MGSWGEAPKAHKVWHLPGFVVDSVLSSPPDFLMRFSCMCDKIPLQAF